MLNSAVLHRAAEQLKADMAGLAEEREALGKELNAAPANRSEEIGRLKGRLESLLHEFQQRSRGSAKPAAAEAVVAQPAPPAPPSRAEKPAEKPVEKPREEHQETKPPEAPAGKPVDAPALAHALFQNGDYDGALQAYRLVDVKTLNPEERAAIQYMTATCLRRLGKFDDASVLYREVANSKTSEVLVECAQWQLNSIAWRKDLESQLEQLRERRKAVESKP
jgi:tetratricopeptide (TPR) repeat protein